MDSAANIKAASVAAKVAIVHPTTKAVHDVRRVKFTQLGQADGHAQSHACIVGPFTPIEIEGAAANHIGDRWEGASRKKFHGRRSGIATGQPEQTSSKSISYFHMISPFVDQD